MVRGWLLAPCLLTACIAERTIDQIVADHGVTWIPESSSGGDEPVDASSSSTDTSTASDSAEDTSSTGDDTTGTIDPDTSTTSSSTTSDDTTTTSTGGPTPFCGDGVINGPAEECDDGNADPDDWCVDCYRGRLVFASSVQLSGATVNGFTGADAYCKAYASMAKQNDPDSPITDPGKFKAFLSDSQTDAIDRHFPGKGPYFLVNGLRVSRSFAALFTEPLENPINVDENSQTVVDGSAWTGTGADGKRYPGTDFCGDWHDLWGTASYGYNKALDTGWVHFKADTDCLSERPIYCFEQE
jgi:hypothetical protein